MGIPMSSVSLTVVLAMINCHNSITGAPDYDINAVHRLWIKTNMPTSPEPSLLSSLLLSPHGSLHLQKRLAWNVIAKMVSSHVTGLRPAARRNHSYPKYDHCKQHSIYFFDVQSQFIVVNEAIMVNR